MEQSVELKNRLRAAFLATGAIAVGFAAAAPVEESMQSLYKDWLAQGRNAGMAFLANHAELRSNPEGLLPGTRTVIAMAYSFAPHPAEDPAPGRIACYAYGLDYHDVLRKRLQGAIGSLSNEVHAGWRICIDSAPVPERYWAVKAGIGYTGRNGAVIIPGHGSMVFLALVLTTLAVPGDTPLDCSCYGCDACRRICPGKAILSDGTVDSRRCLSYLTIEHRDPWTDPEALATMQSDAGRKCLFGCDLCLRVCPYNLGIPPCNIPEFRPLPVIPTLTAERIIEMDKQEFSRLFKGSPIKRAKFEGLLRNSLNTLD